LALWKMWRSGNFFSKSARHSDGKEISEMLGFCFSYNYVKHLSSLSVPLIPRYLIKCRVVFSPFILWINQPRSDEDVICDFSTTEREGKIAARTGAVDSTLNYLRAIWARRQIDPREREKERKCRTWHVSNLVEDRERGCYRGWSP